MKLKPGSGPFMLSSQENVIKYKLTKHWTHTVNTMHIATVQLCIKHHSFKQTGIK